MGTDIAHDWDAIRSAARREGRVIVYSAARGNPVSPLIVARFREQHAIDVDLVEERTEVVGERIGRELAAGAVRGDVTLNGATATAAQFARGHFMPHGPLPRLVHLRPEFPNDGVLVPVFAVHYGLLVNTTQVSPAERPATWRDLLHPRWRDRILCDDFRQIGAGGILFSALLGLHGEEFHHAFAAQRPRFSLASRSLEQRVAAGEFAVFTPFTLPNLADLRNLPVEGYAPAEGAPGVRFNAALLAGAPRPNAARLFLDFLLSPEIQAAYLARAFGTVTTGVAGPAPRTLAPTPGCQTDDLLTLARRIYAGVPLV